MKSEKDLIEMLDAFAATAFQSGRQGEQKPLADYYRQREKVVEAFRAHAAFDEKRPLHVVMTRGQAQAVFAEVQKQLGSASFRAITGAKALLDALAAEPAPDAFIEKLTLPSTLVIDLLETLTRLSTAEGAHPGLERLRADLEQAVLAAAEKKNAEERQRGLLG